jgi:hypothetical protein
MPGRRFVVRIDMLQHFPRIRIERKPAAVLDCCDVQALDFPFDIPIFLREG